MVLRSWQCSGFLSLTYYITAIFLVFLTISGVIPAPQDSLPEIWVTPLDSESLLGTPRHLMAYRCSRRRLAAVFLIRISFHQILMIRVTDGYMSCRYQWDEHGALVWKIYPTSVRKNCGPPWNISSTWRVGDNFFVVPLLLPASHNRNTSN